MKFKISSMSSNEKTTNLHLEPVEEIKPQKEFDEIKLMINKLKESPDEINKMTAANLEVMISYFESIEAKENRQFKPNYSILIDKQIFKEQKLQLDDIVTLEVQKVKEL